MDKNCKDATLYFKALELTKKRAVKPISAIIHPSNKCSHRCEGCEYLKLHAGKEELDEADLVSLINDIAELGAHSIIFSGGGEPIMNKGFVRALEQAKRNGLSAGILTNGSGIDAPTAEAIVENASFCRISVDASTAETYASIRNVPVESYYRLQKNVDNIVDLKKKRGSNTKIGLKFLVRKSNLEEVASFIVLSEELGVDNVQFKPVRNFENPPSENELENVEKVLEDERKKSRSVIILGTMARTKATMKCFLSPLRVVISADGNLQLCNYFEHRSSHCYGNVRERRLKDIWFSPQHRKAMDSIKVEECGHYDCRFHGLNRRLAEMVANQREKFDFV